MPWIASLLDYLGHDASVTSALIEPIGTGQMASSLRVRPTYAHASASTPSSFVLKMASNDENSRAAGARGAYLKEVRFYQQLSQHLDVATPAALWSGIDVETSDFAIALEDMNPAQQGDQIRGCGVDELQAATRNIAALHAPHWCDESLFDMDWLTVARHERAAGARELQIIVAAVTPGFVDRYRDRIDDRQIDLLQWFAETCEEWVLDDGGRFGLTHCDHRLDNLLFNASDADRPVTVVDWQTVAVRNPVTDMSYLLGTSVEPEVRREIERPTLEVYHAQLLSRGVDNYSFEACWDDYRRQSPHSLLLTVMGSMLTVQTNRGDDMFMAMLRRSSEQIADLDAR